MGETYEKIKKFYDGGKDYVFVSLWLAGELDALKDRLSELESELEDVDMLRRFLTRAVAEYLTIGKICDMILERGKNKTKIGEFKTDKGVFNVFIELEEVDSDG